MKYAKQGAMQQTLRGHALRMNVAMVLFSWIGLEMLTIGIFYQKLGDPLRSETSLYGGFALLLCSLLFALWLRRTEVVPSRESAQLFFWAFILVQPCVLWSIWKFFLHHARHRASFGLNSLLPYFSISGTIALVYMILVVIWLHIAVVAYPDAKPNTLSHRVIHKLRDWCVTSYVKDN
jgi:hypothetical protein